MLVAESRPRNLKWYHAGPMLFGDWGTSRLYVLGLAFYYTGHASMLYLGLMSIIMAAVAWAYTVVCRCFPDGGGVYTAARQLNPTLSVIGATLLLCDYIVTAALSGVEAYHYFGLGHQWVIWACIGTIVLIGILNWLGARNAGRFALVIAVLAIATSAVIGVLCLRYIPRGLSTVTTHVEGLGGPFDRWESLVRIVLALSGVEAVANMTGLMRQPVARTARRTIWPVLIEVVLLNAVFGLALNALPQMQAVATPDYVTYEVRAQMAPEDVPQEVKEYRDTAVKMLAQYTAGHSIGPLAGRIMGTVAGIVFGLLLLSAVNTAVMAMVAVQYSLAQDRELPAPLARLNYSGVPRVPLVLACILPAGVLLIFGGDVKTLGELYAIGVVGAITINVLSCAANGKLPIKPWERRAMWGLGALMALIELTIIIAKPRATLFAGSVVGAVLVSRFLLHRLAKRPDQVLPAPALGWLAEIKAALPTLDPARPRIMLAARGRYQSEFAVDLARQRGAALFAIYVRTLRLIDVVPGAIPRIEDDPEAQQALGTTAVLARQAGVPFFPIYVTSTDIAAEILDYTVTYGCDTLIMGKSQRAALARRLTGDVIAQVADHLPDNVALITRSPEVPHTPGSSAGVTYHDLRNGTGAEPDSRPEDTPPPT
jgi:amino acid transporter